MTIKQQIAATKIMENRGNVSKGMLEAGYSPATAKNPMNLTKSLGWGELMNKFLDDKKLMAKHKKLLNSMSIGHMVFPLAMTDEEITKLLKSVNCTPKKFMHGDTANHCWFWMPDNRAVKDALELAYKIKGRFPKEGGIPETFNQQNNFINLNDDQLDQLIKAKLKQSGISTATSGETEADTGEPA